MRYQWTDEHGNKLGLEEGRISIRDNTLGATSSFFPSSAQMYEIVHALRDLEVNLKQQPEEN